MYITVQKRVIIVAALGYHSHIQDDDDDDGGGGGDV